MRRAVSSLVGEGVPMSEIALLAGPGVPPRRFVIAHALRLPILDVLEGSPSTPGDVVAELVREWSWSSSLVETLQRAERLHRLFTAAARPRSTSLLAGALYPIDVASLRAFDVEVAAALRVFADSRPVPSVQARSRDGISFPMFASALSGAGILIDSSTTRALHVDGLKVWHRRSYRDAKLVPGDYTDMHRPPSQALPTSRRCEYWVESAVQPGDFDRRMLDLRAVSLVVDEIAGTVSFLIETTETCYGSSERGDLSGCKKVPVLTGGHETNDPVFRDDGDRVKGAADSRLCLLTSYLTVITADGCVVLAHRSRSVRNGADVLSAFAGGVVEINEPGPAGDVDERGLPDPIATVIRETREEVGLELPKEGVRPVTVFLVNSRGRTAATQAQGQLVAVVLHLARVGRTFSDLERLAEHGSDLSRGRFEWDRLEACPSTTPEAIAGWAAERSASLDQHGLLSLVYASMTLHGPEQTMEAFATAFAGSPWWEAVDVEDHRVCRDPGPLLGMSTEELRRCLRDVARREHG